MIGWKVELEGSVASKRMQTRVFKSKREENAGLRSHDDYDRSQKFINSKLLIESSEKSFKMLKSFKSFPRIENA